VAQETQTKIITILKKYLPLGTIDYFIDLFDRYPVLFVVVPPRSTKSGDFSVKDSVPKITINNDLNPYAFLVTLIHEFAHLKTWREHGVKIKPHGTEWKNNFIELMQPILQLNSLPEDIQQAIRYSFYNVRASSCTDIQLNRTLHKYDVIDAVPIEQLPDKAIFILQKKTFRKEVFRRTRYLCTELPTGKKYLIHQLANVIPISIYE